MTPADLSELGFAASNSELLRWGMPTKRGALSSCCRYCGQCVDSVPRLMLIEQCPQNTLSSNNVESIKFFYSKSILSMKVLKTFVAKRWHHIWKYSKIFKNIFSNSNREESCGRRYEETTFCSNNSGQSLPANGESHSRERLANVIDPSVFLVESFYCWRLKIAYRQDTWSTVSTLCAESFNLKV